MSGAVAVKTITFTPDVMEARKRGEDGFLAGMSQESNPYPETGEPYDLGWHWHDAWWQEYCTYTDNHRRY